MRKGPGFFEDTKNLAIIGGAALLGVVATGAMAFSSSDSHNYTRTYVVDTDLHHEFDFEYEIVTPLEGTNRLYGTVHTDGGEVVTGYLRWDKNEASWGDLLDASKQLRRSSVQSGLRFGHVERLEPLGSDEALLTLRSGKVIELHGGATDLGRGLRALEVSSANGNNYVLEWRDIDAVDFHAADAEAPREGRLYGTLQTQDGAEYTGTITWDVDEVYSSDELDGDMRSGRDVSIPFGAIEKIERESRRAARVHLHGGEVVVLDGSNDVDHSNRGIAVSDINLGQVLVKWDEFRSVSFHGAHDEPTLDIFDGGRPLTGTVLTKAGGEVTGTIAWDRDETMTWELLNGDANGIEYDVEFGNIKSIRNLGNASEVTLHDGRVLRLRGSNDVDRGNKGIEVTSEDGETLTIPWDIFEEVRFNR